MDTENWIGDVLRPKEQRAALVAFADSIGARRKFGEDEAGNPRIEGRHGAIYVQPSTCSPGQQPRFQIYFSGGTKGWRFAKEAIGRFAKLTNDGDTDGMFALDRLPTKYQGEVLRDKLDIPKRRTVSDETLARLRAMGNRFGAPANEAGDAGSRLAA